ncbi:hypothetical protein HanRHA438_Chr08g0355991 [Helianthus annuus]|nr:hypothetical protein HanRHA438_Chr08g0355991 [Helianthus annuus]
MRERMGGGGSGRWRWWSLFHGLGCDIGTTSSIDNHDTHTLGYGASCMKSCFPLKCFFSCGTGTHSSLYH